MRVDRLTLGGGLVRHNDEIGTNQNYVRFIATDCISDFASVVLYVHLNTLKQTGIWLFDAY